MTLHAFHNNTCTTLGRSYTCVQDLLEVYGPREELTLAFAQLSLASGIVSCTDVVFLS